MNTYYPSPQQMGGLLIRKIVGFLKKYPFIKEYSQVLIAFSTGPDSTALAHLLIKYGKNLFKRENLQLLHINHHWRGEESDQDQAFAQSFAQKFGIHRITQIVRYPVYL